MLKIGLTGGIASGKSTVCRLFSQYGIPIIDADVIARQLVEPKQEAYNEIVHTFGDNICLPNGELNRQYLRKLIFSDDKAKHQLEMILHPRIRLQLFLRSAALNTPYCILAIPLLIEAEMTELVDRVLLVDIDLALQLTRLCERDNISLDDAQLMINSQVNRQQRLACADDIIANNNSAENLKKQVDKLHKKYFSLANNSPSSCQHNDSHGQ
ncbi:MAG: dephospho-CoA kinase [Pseudomonadota bacterium]|nr:dephospho-CoA kinase [Pseudomonadota bacterium]